VELDDQLAALAAGEPDDDTTRALQARVAADPALAARLARFRRLEAALRADAGPVAMDPAAVRRMDAVLDEALAALPDAPLLGAAAPTVAATTGAGSAVSGSARDGDDRVVDLADARARRTPRWVAGVAAAAAVLAGVVVVGPSVLGGDDDAARDTIALDSADQDAQRMDGGDDTAATMESEAADEAESQAADEAAPEPQDDAGDDAGGTADASTTEQDAPGDDGTTLAGVPVQPYAGDDAALTRLLSSPAVGDARSSVGNDGEALDARRREQQAALPEAGDEPLVECAGTALDLEPAGALALLGTGTHEGVNAVVAVLVRPDRSALALALATDGCEVLGRAEG